MRSSTIVEIFVPLVGNFISIGTVEHHLVDVAIMTTGRMARRLACPAYYALVQKYLGLSESKDGECVYVRTLVSLLDNFHFPIDQIISENGAVDTMDDEDEPGEDPTSVCSLGSNVSREFIRCSVVLCVPQNC
jgi:U3 small nucleolar RNA-associated protein 20